MKTEFVQNPICELKHIRVDEKLEQIHSDVREIKSTLKDLTTFKIKAVTTITFLVFIINIFGLFLFEKIF